MSTIVERLTKALERHTDDDVVPAPAITAYPHNVMDAKYTIVIRADQHGGVVEFLAPRGFSGGHSRFASTSVKAVDRAIRDAADKHKVLRQRWIH